MYLGWLIVIECDRNVGDLDMKNSGFGLVYHG